MRRNFKETHRYYQHEKGLYGFEHRPLGFTRLRKRNDQPEQSASQQPPYMCSVIDLRNHVADDKVNFDGEKNSLAESTTEKCRYRTAVFDGKHEQHTEQSENRSGCASGVDIRVCLLYTSPSPRDS